MAGHFRDDAQTGQKKNTKKIENTFYRFVGAQWSRELAPLAKRLISFDP